MTLIKLLSRQIRPSTVVREPNCLKMLSEEKFVVPPVGFCEHKDCVMKGEEREYRKQNSFLYRDNTCDAEQIVAIVISDAEGNTFEQEVKKKQETKDKPTKSIHLDIFNDKVETETTGSCKVRRHKVDII
jgi:hypothetical protein